MVRCGSLVGEKKKDLRKPKKKQKIKKKRKKKENSSASDKSYRCTHQWGCCKRKNQYKNKIVQRFHRLNLRLDLNYASPFVRGLTLRARDLLRESETERSRLRDLERTRLRADRERDRSLERCLLTDLERERRSAGERERERERERELRRFTERDRDRRSSERERERERERVRERERERLWLFDPLLQKYKREKREKINWQINKTGSAIQMRPMAISNSRMKMSIIRYFGRR